jgi:acyl-CoA synthetase (AMP-forming)/AMP-acid ligase II
MVKMDPNLPASIQSVPEALAFWAERAPESTALLSPGQAPVTYGELHDRAGRLAAALRMLGLGRRHATALVFPDGLEFCVALLAAMTVGAAVPLAWPGTEPDYRRVLSRCRVRAVVAADESADAMRLAAGPAVPVVTDDETTAGQPGALFARADDGLGPDPSFPEVDEDLAVVLKSAGTTGRPKLIPRTHRNIASFCRDFIEARALTPADRGLSLARSASSQGLHTLATTIFAGSSLIVISGLDHRALPGWLRTYRPTYLSAPPAVLRALAAEPVALQETGLRCVFATSAPLRFEEAERMESELGAPILNMYGLTEATGIAAERFPRERRVPGSVGPAWCDVRVIGEGGECLGPNEAGEILVRGPRVSPGYLDDPELNAASFVDGGWLRTGDLGFVDEAGYVHLRGRSGEIVNRGGEKIDPGEVDAVLLACPALADAAAFAVPDALLGEDIVAAVVPASGATLTARQLRSWLLDRLMSTQSPRRIWFVEDIPRTANGKVQRGELARRWEAARE